MWKQSGGSECENKSGGSESKNESCNDCVECKSTVFLQKNS